MSFQKRILTPVIAIVLTASILTGCDGATHITGVVLDPHGRPVADANARLAVGSHMVEATSSIHGVFKIGLVHSPWNPELSLTVAKQGYESFEKRFQASDHLESIVVTLKPVAEPSASQPKAPAELSPECLATTLEQSALPTDQWTLLPGQSYKGPPLVAFEIAENGIVRDVRIVRSSGVRGLDSALVSAISKWKYKPRPGCPTIESKMSMEIHWQ